MFYEAQDAQRRHSIGVASSDSEGLEWRRRPGGPVLEPSDVVDSWDGAAVARPWLVPLDDGSARLYYLGRQPARSPTPYSGRTQSDRCRGATLRRMGLSPHMRARCESRVACHAFCLRRSEDGVQAIGAAQSDGTNWFNWRRISRLKVV
mmetsp:Transcript_9755/g.23717  ORF Transcript_9755/g.23717 Transcript_9755/m.23717 type:complete len:149 (-) Transcript_9755:355-801(-)